jgi:hypothetical protein
MHQNEASQGQKERRASDNRSQSEKPPRTDFLTIPPQGNKPEDRCERAGDGHVRSKVDTNQKRTSDLRRH